MSNQAIPVTPNQVRQFRMVRSGLLAPFAAPEAAASALFGIQAQILPAAAVALWNRTSGLTHGGIETLLFERRTLIKLWGQRGTLHLYPSDEWPLVCGMITNTPSWWGQNAQKADQYDAYSALVEKTAELLRARGTMGRSDLRALRLDGDLAFDDEHLSGWGGLFADLVRRGYACHAGRSDNEGIFAAREFWLPQLAWDPPEVEEANRIILRRYIRSYGPTTVSDFIYWRAPKSANTRRWWEEVAPELVAVDVEGARQYLFADELEQLLAMPAAHGDSAWPLHMLYRFDPLLLAHKDKHWIVPPRYYKNVWRPAGHIEGVILVDGQAAATWRYERKGRGLAILVQPFRKLNQRVQKQIGRKSAEIANFFSLPLMKVEIGD
jgi:hypothetical protein